MKQVILIIVLFISLTGCEKGEFPDIVGSPTTPAPVEATLVSPAANEACTQGVPISASENTITLKWNMAAYADNYEVTVKNLLSGAVTTQSVTTNQLDVNLLINTPYSWYVTSKSAQTSETGRSAVWKFYNAGAAMASYIPFPADNLMPAMREAISSVNGEINLSWSAEDADNDISEYDVYLGTSSTVMPILQAGVKDKHLNGVAVTSGTYYWRVVTKDAKGNSSDSGVYTFSVN